eukprot:SAG31_NODE_6634_length_1943_cov_1.889913_2_plen_58_part_00
MIEGSGSGTAAGPTLSVAAAGAHSGPGHTRRAARGSMLPRGGGGLALCYPAVAAVYR